MIINYNNANKQLAKKIKNYLPCAEVLKSNLDCKICFKYRDYGRCHFRHNPLPC